MRSDGWYTSPSQLEAEKRLVFRRLPIIVGRETDLEEPGRFFTLDAAGVALLLTRDGEGTARAMLNSCRHRSAQLVFEAAGSAEKFVCRHHAWTYDLAGQLARPGRVALPAALERSLDQFASDCALVRFPSESRHGFLWVVTSTRASIELAAVLGDADRELAHRVGGLADHVVIGRTTTIVAASWKLVMDALLAGEDRLLVFPSSVFAFAQETVWHAAVFPNDVGETTLVQTALARAPHVALPSNPFDVAIELAARAQRAIGTGEASEHRPPASAAFHDALEYALCAPL